MSMDTSLSQLNLEINYRTNNSLNIEVTQKLNAMMDLLSRIIAIEEILFFDQQPKNEQLILALNQFEGIVLDELSDFAAKLIKNYLFEINSILANYPIKTMNDYNFIRCAPRKGEA